MKKKCLPVAFVLQRTEDMTKSSTYFRWGEIYKLLITSCKIPIFPVSFLSLCGLKLYCQRGSSVIKFRVTVGYSTTRARKATHIHHIIYYKY